MKAVGEDSGLHVVALTKAEVDQFFDPFDPNDHSMPSYLHRAGHRWIKQFIYDWLVDNFGEPETGAWAAPRPPQFAFADKNHAMLFITYWHGNTTSK